MSREKHNVTETEDLDRSVEQERKRITGNSELRVNESERNPMKRSEID